MNRKGVNYDIGTLTTRNTLSRETFDPAIVRREIEIIRTDLRCTAIRISGKDIERLVFAAEYALRQGLEVWFSPTLTDYGESMDNPSELLSEPESKERLTNWVAVSVAVLAAFMADAKVKDDNIVQAMLQAKSDAVDTWSEYQSSRIKHHLLELGRDQTIALREPAANQTSTILDGQLKRYESEIARHQKEESELQQKARGF